MISARFLLHLAKKEGFQRAVVTASSDLKNSMEIAFKRVSTLGKKGIMGKSRYESLVNSWKELNYLGIGVNSTSDNGKGNGTFLICALSTYRDEPDDLSIKDSSYALIARFARRNFYGDAVSRLKRIFKVIREETGLKKRDGRIFSNSRLPEKPIAVGAGLGVYGKNSLVLIPGLGSSFVIAGLYIPVEVEIEKKDDLLTAEGVDAFAMCKGCRKCIEACPTGAIIQPAVIDEKKCISYISARDMELSEEFYKLWGNRLYGCDTCQQVCPYNMNLRETSDTEKGDIGLSMPIKDILEMDVSQIKEMFKGTQMGLSWVSGNAIIRNALVSAGNSGNGSLKRYVHRFVNSPINYLQEAAKWAMQTLK